MRILVPAFLLVAAAGCASQAELTESQEYFVGRAVAAQAIEKGRILRDEALENYVALVGYTVALESDRPETFKGYHFGILEADAVNAFAAPSGFIFITTGALKAMQTEDELAAVLAHEIAHVSLRHPEIVAARSAEKSGALDVLRGAAGFLRILGVAAAESSGDRTLIYTAEQLATLVEGLGEVVIEFAGNIQINGYGRDSELAADALAVDLLTRPGVRYDPRALGAFISRLPKNVDRGGAFWSTSTHPGLEDRLQKLDEEIKKEAIQKRGPLPQVEPARTRRFKAATAGLKGP